MGKKFSGVSQTMSRFRGWIQAGATLLTNLHLPNFLKGGLYQGAGKTVCVPGLNCYSCPAASGACPIGAFQAVVGSSKFSFSYYITGFLILLGVLLGRFICGFLCPFGWFQELLHKIPTKKLSTKRLKPLTYLKYAVLLVMVFLLPAFLVNDVGMGDPFFCKYLCPQGVLEGAIPLSLANSGIRAALGSAAQRAIIPMYDWLGLGAEAHLNTPGRLGGNWAWRAEAGFETDALAQTILTECSVCCRTGQDLLLRALPKGWSAQDAAKAEKPAAQPTDKAAARA